MKYIHIQLTDEDHAKLKSLSALNLRSMQMFTLDLILKAIGELE